MPITMPPLLKGGGPPQAVEGFLLYDDNTKPAEVQCCGRFYLFVILPKM